MSNVQRSRKRTFSIPPRVVRSVRAYAGRFRRRRGKAWTQTGGLRISKPRYQKALMWKGPGLLPQKYYTTSKYQYFYHATTAAPGFYDWVLRGNSIYDPDVAIGGESTTGFDAMMAIFTKYCVTASAIRVRAVNQDTDEAVDVTIIPTRDAGAFAVANANAVRGHNLAKFMVVPNQQGQGVITHFCTTKDACGVKDASDIGFVGTATTDPTHMWYWHVILNNHSANALNIQLWLEIDYSTTYSDQYPVTQ